MLFSHSVWLFVAPWPVAPPGSVHGTSQAKHQSGLPFYSPGLSYQPRDRTRVSCIGRQNLYSWATRGGGRLGRTWSEEGESPRGTLVESCVERPTSSEQLDGQLVIGFHSEGQQRKFQEEYWDRLIHRFGYQAGSLPSTLRLMPLKIFHRRSPKADENMRNASVNWLKKKKKSQPKSKLRITFY